MLGLRFVKETIHFDFGRDCHRSFADEQGTPEAVLTCWSEPPDALRRSRREMIHTTDLGPALVSVHVLVGVLATIVLLWLSGFASALRFSLDFIGHGVIVFIAMLAVGLLQTGWLVGSSSASSPAGRPPSPLRALPAPAGTGGASTTVLWG
ncbi:MAG: hypothetical protein LBJ87_08660 [bacterium]|jgi:hypothetical protein|nr:hypothetical protein [bacterium]